MKTRSRRSLSLMSLILLLAILFVGCAADSGIGSIDSGSNADAADAACAHEKTELKNFLAATCSAKGYSGDVVCLDCGMVLTLGNETEVPHAWNEGEQTKAPTCMETGIFTYTCTVCTATKIEAIAVTAHENLYHDALDGTHNHTCSMCTMSEYEEHVPVDSEGRFYEADCTTPAYTRYECSLCGKYYRVYSEAEEDAATGHDWGDWTVDREPTCSQEGKKTHTCGDCGDVETVKIPTSAASHVFVEQSRVSSTCTVAGSATYKCKFCIATETRDLPLAAHDLNTVTGNDGWTHSDCKDCEYTVSSFDASTQSFAAVDTSALNTEKSFAVTTNAATVEFPKEVVEQMASGDSVQIDAGVLDETAKENALSAATALSPEDKSRLENVDIFNFSVSTVDGDFTEKVTVTIPYELKTGEDPEGILVWFVGTDGTLQAIPATYADGFVTFEAEHFSYYAVAYKETQEMKCRRGVHAWEKTTQTVAPSCEHYGYTLYECTCCHVFDVKDIVEKLNHAYGELTAPEVTCETGGYWYKECANCHDVKNFTYVRATGHTLNMRATCTESAVCQTCNEIAEYALGHSFGEWSTVTEVTDVSAGLRRRSCAKCGTTEEVRIAPTGNVELYDFADYQDMLEFILSDILHFENGTVTFETKLDDETAIKMDVTIQKTENEGYVMLMDVAVTAFSVREEDSVPGIQPTQPKSSSVPEKESEVQTYRFVYRDGVVVYLIESDAEGFVGNLDEINGYLPFEIFTDYMEQYFDRVSPRVEGSFDEISELLGIFDAFAGEEINEVLSDLGFTVQIGELADLFAKLKNLYVYNAQKLGFQTGVSIEGEVPTAADMMEILSHYMKVTDGEDGQKLYTFDLTEATEALETVLDWIEERETHLLSDVLYELLSDELAELYPDIKSYDDLEAQLRKSFTANMKLGKAIDRMLTLLEKKDGVDNVNGLYKLLEALSFEMTGVKLDIQDYIVRESDDATLNDFVCDMFDCKSLDDFFNQMHEYLTDTYLGDATAGYRSCYDENGRYTGVEEVSVSELLDEIRAELELVETELDFVLVTDENGYLVSMDLDMLGSYEDESGSYSLSVKSDNSVSVTLPDAFDALSIVKITKRIKENGDLEITVPEGYDYELSISGSGSLPLADLVEKDSAASASLSADVYVLKQQYWTNTDWLDERYVEIDGKYYTYSSQYTSSYREIVDELPLAQLQDDWTILLPAETDEPDGYLRNDRATPVYTTALGLLYQNAQDKWMLATDYDYYREAYGSGATATLTYYYEIMESALAETVLESIRISNFERYSSYVFYKDGATVNAMKMYLSADGLDETIPVYVCVDQNNDLLLLDYENVDGTSRYVLGEELASLPAHDEIERWQTSSVLYDKNGAPITKSVYFIELAKYIPTYYLKVEENVFIPLSLDTKSDGGYDIKLPTGIVTVLNTADKDPVTLPNGRTMYVIQRGDSVAYGYTKLNANLYVQTACFYEGDTIVRVTYRNEVTALHVAYDDFVDVDRYTTKNGSTWTVSATLFDVLKELCVNEGSSFSIYAEAEKTVGGNEYELYDVLYTYMVACEDLFATGSSSNPNRYVSWYEIFGSGSSYRPTLFEIVPNRDGSITVYTDVSTLTVTYSLPYNGGKLDSFVKPDAEKSEEVGQDVYYTEAIEFGGSYVYKNGRYYEYSTYDVLEYTTITNLRTLIADHWHLQSLYYGYEAEVEGESLPVYLGTVYFGTNYGGESTISVFFAVQNGKLCALAGAEKIGDSVIQFEELIPADTYFGYLADGATVNDDGSYISRFFYETDGDKMTLYRNDVVLSGDARVYGDTYLTSILYLNGSQKKFMTAYNDVGSVLELGDETEEDIYDIEYRSTYTDINGTYEIVEVRVRRVNYYVKLLGQYYSLENYLDRRIDEETFLEYMTDEYEYFYGVSENGVMKYYNRVDYNGGLITLSEPLYQATPYAQSEPYEIGMTADGRKVYEYYGRVMNVNSETQADGTVFYYDRYNDGYLLCKDGYYISAYYSTDSQTQTKTLYIEGMGAATLTQSQLQAALNGCLTYGAGSVTLDKKLLTLIPESAQQTFVLRVGYNGYYLNLDYEDLTGWFAIAQGQNSSGKFYEWNNGEFLPAA